MSEYELINPSENVQPIQWKAREDFRGRFMRVSSIGYDGKIEIGEAIPVPDDEVICDACNASVDEFPCAVVGSYALCSSCRKRWAIEPGDTEYFESLAYVTEAESPKPRVNFGGRKR